MMIIEHCNKKLTTFNGKLIQFEIIFLLRKYLFLYRQMMVLEEDNANLLRNLSAKEEALRNAQVCIAGFEENLYILVDIYCEDKSIENDSNNI